jgi:YidC/Oxa1 family membrane protein insertase
VWRWTVNRQELSIVVLLFIALVAWGYFFRPSPPEKLPSVEEKSQQVDSSDGESGSGVENNDTTPEDSPSSQVPPLGTEPVSLTADEEPSEEPVPEKEIHQLPETTVLLASDEADLTFSSWGGGVVSSKLKNYRTTIEKDSEPVLLDFSAWPALSLSGIPGLSTNNDFSILSDPDGKWVHIERTTVAGLKFERTVTVTNGHRFQVTDVFSNQGAADLDLPECKMRIGPMHAVLSKSKTRGIAYLGIDSLPLGGGLKTTHWAKKGPAEDKRSLSGRFHLNGSPGGCAMFRSKITERLPVVINVGHEGEIDWAGVKNKFFVQLLAPKGAADGLALQAKRIVPESETPDESRTWQQSATLEEVSGALCFKKVSIAPGSSVTRTASYYVGPKKHSLLKPLGNKQEEVMEFGFFSPLSKILLTTLNAIYGVVRNYGLAVILLTILVRLVFWPITHKSTESMKKMQELQPEIKKVREKHKDKPQKMNQEIMALYKENKVNPMAGCLPVLVQIPVFIALFTVLRSAVELRFASFLWIKDLSEPEGLFAGTAFFAMMPSFLKGGLNILPIFMTGTMIWQQKLTPSGGDPQQQKMMTLMPIMFFFIFYNMASALVLYWSVSQCLSIVQLLLQRRKKSEKS